MKQFLYFLSNNYNSLMILFLITTPSLVNGISLSLIEVLESILSSFILVIPASFIFYMVITDRTNK